MTIDSIRDKFKADVMAIYGSGEGQEEEYRELIWDGWVSEEDKAAIKALGFEHIEQEGGGEGGTEACHSVFKLKDKFYMIEGSYYSYDGEHVEYDDWEEVKPVTISKTEYQHVS